MPFFRRRTVWWPTWLGFGLMAGVAAAVGSLWWFRAEPFLSVTDKVPADVLVVEGWIGGPGIRAAAHEFAFGGYRFVVATGPLTGERWYDRRWNYAEIAQQQLSKAGVPEGDILMAPAGDPEEQRTYRMAVAARDALAARSLQPRSINIFTRGSHGRRSRLVYEKVFGPETKIGVISWLPPGYETEPWWHSSDRAEDLLKETVGYAFERTLRSGRW